MPAPSGASPNKIDQGGQWFWNFLKQELSPFPGRAWIVGRVTISATIVMIVVMTFRIPSGFLGATFVFLLSRENPTATLRAGLRTVTVFLIGTVYTAFSVRLFIGDPLTHFLWVVVSVFLTFYMLRILDYATAAAFGFNVLGAVPLWDQTSLNVNTLMENTLWLAGVVSLGVIVSVAVEYIFRGVHPTSDLNESIENRLRTIENILLSAAKDQPLADQWQKKLALYSTVGTSRLNRLLIRSKYSGQFKAQMGTAVALIGRLMDTAASFELALADKTIAISAADRQRCMRLAAKVNTLCINLIPCGPSSELEQPIEEAPSQLPFLSAMERTVELIPKAFSGSEPLDIFTPPPLDAESSTPLFAADAFSNPDHVYFALRGTLAAMVCYITYTAIDWPGLSTSVLTCFITALSTIGSSRQKQVLRLSGAFIGGIIFGMGAQVFVLPSLDSIAGFTPLFIIVTAIAAWFSTASSRLSYLGVQLALAFYVINLQEFTIQTSLAVARDRVFGVLLAIVSMGIFFDLLWTRNALNEMQVLFARNLKMFAELTEQLLEKDHIAATRRILQLRDQINEGFQAVNAQSDAVLLDFSRSRQENLKIRKNIRRLQPAIQTLLQVQVTAVEYIAQNPMTNLPEPIAQAGIGFERDVATTMRALANEVTEKPADEVPDIRLSAANVRREIDKYYQGLGAPVSADAADIVDLIENLASVLAPLHEEIHASFVGAPDGAGAQPHFLRVASATNGTITQQ